MMAPTMEPADARMLVEARLGRAPQDMLEAAVVLEAWAGVPAQAALAAASATMPVEPALPQPSVGRLPRIGDGEGVLAAGMAFMVTVVAIACWAAPLTSSMGGTERLCEEGGGGVVFTVAYMMAFTLSPSKGAMPVSAS